MKITLILLLSICLFFCSCSQNISEADFKEKPQNLASTAAFKPYHGNPVVTMGEKGEWDAGALGSMTVLKVGDTFHMYYESWGVRSEADWDASEYESL
ncbi:MAG: hypothetical protein ACYST2_01955, partial [Planctomycetota bacterium]